MSENILCTRIAQLRRERGFTQEQLADRLGVSFQAVSKWENNQSCPDIMLLPQLADIFGVNIDYLFGRETPAPVAIPAVTAERQAETDLPWPDDNGFYAVLFQGHRLVSEGGMDHEFRFTYSGPAVNVSSQFDLVCENCEIHGNVSAGGDVACGSVGGSVNAEGDVRCDGGVEGGVNAVGDMSCAGVEGDVSAGGDVNCDGVEGSVIAGGDVDCSGVGQNVEAGGDVDCGSVGGWVSAGGDVDCGTVGGNVKAGGDVSGGQSRTERGHVKRGKVMWGGKQVGDYSAVLDEDGEDIDLSELGETVKKTVRESLKSVQDTLRKTFGDEE